MVNAHTGARRRKIFNVGRVIVLNDPPAWVGSSRPLSMTPYIRSTGRQGLTFDSFRIIVTYFLWDILGGVNMSSDKCGLGWR